MTWVRCLLYLLVGFSAWAQDTTNAPAFAEAAAGTKKFQLLPGLKLDVWAAEPQLSNGVALSFDGKGRAFIAETHRYGVSVFDITQHTNWLLNDMSFRNVDDRVAFLTNQFATNLSLLTKDSELVRVVEDRDGDGKADFSAVFAEGFNSPADGTAAGVLATGTNVYFGNIPNLWRFPFSPENQKPDNLTTYLLASGFGVHIGVTGHDLHGLIKGPDGRIYLSFGDRGCVLTNREGVVINLPDTGGVLRCEPDGANLEVFCYGLRNPQELAFDDFGNLWTVDNDTAGADDCRVLHLVEGADYGWRTSYQHMEGFGPWVQEELWKGGKDGILPPAGVVSQGPSGLAFYPGTGFSDRLKGKFLHCDFPGGVWAFSVKPKGASYEVDTKEKFLWNCWPTDVEFGPDGAAYVLDWIQGWQMPHKGRIYRITPDLQSPISNLQLEITVQVRRLLAEGMANRGEKELLDLLGHADRRVRLEAQWELAGRGTNSLKGLLNLAREDKRQLARIHALWAVEQIARPLTDDQLVGELYSLIPLLAGADLQVAGQTASVLAETGLMNANEVITKLLENESPRLRFQALMGLARLHRFRPYRIYRSTGTKLAEIVEDKSEVLGAATARLANRLYQGTPWNHVRPLLTELGVSDPFIQFAAISVLIGSSRGLAEHHDWPWEAAHDYSASIRLVALLELRRLTNSALTNFLTDPDPHLIEAAGRAIHDVPIVEGFPALASFITKIDCPTNLYSRVIDACFRLGTQQHAQMLASFAAREDVPDAARVLALRALEDWEKPSPLDRVNGLWRPLVVGTRSTASPSNPQRSISTPSETQEIPSLVDTALPSRPALRGPDGDAVERVPTRSNPVLQRATSFARNFGRAAELPVLPPDLGRSVSFVEGIAVTRNPAPAQRAFLRVAGDLLNPFNLTESGVPAGTREVLPLQIAVAETAARLRVKEASSPLFDKFEKTNTAPELRRAILPTLATLRAPQTPDAVKLALADSDPQLRAAALPFLNQLEGEDAVELLSSLVRAVVNPPTNRSVTSLPETPSVSSPQTASPEKQQTDASSYRLAQAALAALAGIPGAEADQALALPLEAGVAGTLPPELLLDVVAAAGTRTNNSAVAERLAKLTAADSTGDSLAKWRFALAGGNAAQGRGVFFNNSAVQCLRCHKVGNDGGIVGPNLSDIGRRYPREYLLESIVHPNARIGAGFENIVVTLKDGTTQAGLVKRETENTLVLEVSDPESGDVKTVPLRKREIEKREPGLSAMPEGLAELLTPFELRDLVEYLASLR
ncbi:MAG TPA: PQQ-dependent sugar dehydrogenase [Verrucomicrobiota bacterium]|nr:PQQ-dependent sugar dehydrogenase [Verrucomicrobiota bacterium]